ncbi:dihydroorotase [Rhodothermus profundi]|uniref:Dihydroorotase n=1 Tax=Rhodothermus profundi TaxID=633813 RepID=A0A1M6XLA6_9BACT|nr:dihydroorotase [Rhodothermus profundi]SHL06757.1 dihydroorotase [Rhodothermus profundi]
MESSARKTPDLLIRGGILLDPETGRQRRADLLIRNGRIARIAESIEADDVPVYEAAGKFVSPGWMDMHVHLREPGQEHKETIETGCQAAAFGGFTAVACMPNTDPPIHTRDVVEFVIERGRRTPVDVYPIACVSKNREGKELTEMADLVEGGAVAFSDDGAPVQHGGLMRRALEYASMLDRVIINHMEDLTLNPQGHMHEGVVSTRLGVPGIPSLAEEVMVARDLLLAEYTGGHVHVAHISTARSVELVRQAKARGVRVTAEVCPHHFTLTDEAVERTGFSTNTKMHPPLRTAADIAAIKEGLRDGTIDAICTDHAPHASFEKEVEFIEAPFGIIGLETAWGLIGRELIAPGVLTVTEAVYKLTVAPRRILRLPVPRLAEGEPANLTIFDATTRWVFEARHIRSKSQNTPFIGEELVGRAWAIYNRGWFVVQDP